MNKSWWDRAAGLKQNAPKYDGVGKRRILQRYFGASLLTDAEKPTLVVTYDVEARVSAVLKSTHETPVSALDATDASSAAPLYFPTVRVGDRWLIDGGVIANNPALCAYAEAKKLWPGEEIRVLSVGTGLRIRPIPGELSRSFGFLGWITHDLLGVVMDESVVDYQAKTLLGDRYQRVTSRLERASDDMDDCSRGNIEELGRLGGQWAQDFGDQALRLLGH
jgi:predicted acylesterase/phospholipase RssA